MRADEYARLREIFEAAIELPSAEREAYIRARAESVEQADAVLRLVNYDAKSPIKTQNPFDVLKGAVAHAEIGRVIGKYQLVSVLGHGGMGCVYRARRLDDTSQWVAIKVLSPGLFASLHADRFRAEQQILARLNHPGIAHFIDCGTDPSGDSYVVMELVEGQSMSAYADARALGLKGRIVLFRQLLAAVVYAHRELVIHRDIKSANVLVRADGVVKLLDFGIAKMIHESPSITGSRDRVYTPLSAAPEQIRGEACGVTTDVYALGVLLYELITEQPIFRSEGRTPGELENMVLHVPPTDLRARARSEDIRKSISSDLERIVAKSIRKEPNGRYPSVEQLDADLERLLSNQPVAAVAGSAVYRARKFVARYRLASALAALCVLVLLTAVLSTLHQNQQIRIERDRANLALDAMKRAFLAADPSGEMGGEVTARQILESSLQAVETLAASGDGFVELATTVLDVQLSMGLVTDAAKTMALIQTHGVEETSKLCLQGARLFVEERKLPQAELKLAACAPSSATEMLEAKMLTATIYVMRRNLGKALPLLVEVCEGLPPDHPDWVRAQTRLAWTLADLKRKEDALAVLDRAEAVVARSLPERHPSAAHLVLGRLEVLMRSGEPKAVYDSARRFLVELRPKYGENSLLLGRVASVIGQLLNAQEEYAAAIPYLEQALQIDQAVLGAYHRNTQRHEINLLMAAAQVNQKSMELGPRFEVLLQRSEPRVVLREQGGDDGIYRRDFHQFVAVEYAKYLGRRGDVKSSVMVLSGLATGASRLEESGSDTLRDYEEWLNYGYWALGCATDATEKYAKEMACSTAPRQFDALCTSAREALCNPERRGAEWVPLVLGNR